MQLFCLTAIMFISLRTVEQATRTRCSVARGHLACDVTIDTGPIVLISNAKYSHLLTVNSSVISRILEGSYLGKTLLLNVLLSK